MSNFVIDTVEKLKEKVSMVESLSQIEVATKILDDAKDAEDLVDQYYKKLDCEIEQVDSNVSN
jgi:poly [ADP-ribose] polymerase